MRGMLAAIILATLMLTAFAPTGAADHGPVVNAYGTTTLQKTSSFQGTCAAEATTTFSVDTTQGALVATFTTDDDDCLGDIFRGLPTACTELENQTVACNVDEESYKTRIWLEDDGTFLFKYDRFEEDRTDWDIRGTLTLV